MAENLLDARACLAPEKLKSPMRYALGADIGGTFTDLILLRSDGRLSSKKVLSTPDDYSRAIEEGVSELLAEIGVGADEIAEFAHGTTVATNAIIERKGVKVALITTAGFRDVLEIARFRSPRLYDLDFRKPDPLVERRLRFGVRERMMSDGKVLLPLDAGDICSASARRSKPSRSTPSPYASSIRT
jgi:N-methylhydantoinase A